LGDQIKEDEIGGAPSTHGKAETHKIRLQNLKGRDHVEDNIRMDLWVTV